jgi:hypothetical protein
MRAEDLEGTRHGKLNRSRRPIVPPAQAKGKHPVHLVQILLPLFDNDGRRVENGTFHTIRDELTARFGGLTAYTRSPAEGLWANQDRVSRDEIVMVEVMVDPLDRAWWRDYRRLLEDLRRQELVVVRAHAIEQL